MADESLGATTTIHAPAEAIFTLLADPAEHAAIEGTGWVREPLDNKPTVRTRTTRWPTGSRTTWATRSTISPNPSPCDRQLRKASAADELRIPAPRLSPSSLLRSSRGASSDGSAGLDRALPARGALRTLPGK